MEEEFDEIERNLIDDLVNNYYELLDGKASKQTIYELVVETYLENDNADDAAEAMREKLSNAII